MKNAQAAVRQSCVGKRKDVCALNNNYYLRYEKTENVKYVSHLDFVRMFGRALRRAHLPIAYSEGFNPHPLLGFALPLSVGYTSECEILEIALTEELSTDEIKERFNRVLPDGVKILSVHEGKSNMKKLDIALYQVFPEKTPAGIVEFLAMDKILIEKKTKSGIKETDIRPDIKDIKEYCNEQVDTLWDEVKRFENPHTYYVDLSQKLWKEKKKLLDEYAKKGNG